MSKRGLVGLLSPEQESIERESDKLLSECGALGNECLTEQQLTRVMVRQERPDSMEKVWQAQVGSFSEIDEVFVDAVWADIKASSDRYKISIQTVEMVRMRQTKMTYAEIAVACETSAEAARKRVNRAREKMLEMPEFGMWQTIMEMERCLGSQWLRMFWKEMEICKQKLAREDEEK